MSRSPATPSQISVVSPSILVSLATPPWLAAIVGVRAASEFLERLGVASEEVFRGDRLPVLHFSDQVSADPADDPTPVVD